MWLSPPRLLLYALALTSIGAVALAASTPRASEPSSVERRERASAQLEIRLNQERLRIHEDLREVAASLLDRAEEDGKWILHPHEEERLIAELAVQEHAMIRLIPRAGVDVHGLLANEPPRPWLSEGVLDGELLGARMLALQDERAARWASERAIELEQLRIEGDDLARAVIPAAERALGSALEALVLNEAPVVDVLAALKLVEAQRLAEVDLRGAREQLLLDLAHRMGCDVEGLPWARPALKPASKKSPPPLSSLPADLR